MTRPAALLRLRSLARAFSAGPDALTRDVVDVLAYVVEPESALQASEAAEGSQPGLLLPFTSAGDHGLGSCRAARPMSPFESGAPSGGGDTDTRGAGPGPASPLSVLSAPNVSFAGGLDARVSTSGDVEPAGLREAS